MKTQLMCVMVVVFAATSYGTRFNCADQKNCDKCPPVNKNCKNLRKCGCCHICRDNLNPALMRKMFTKSHYTSTHHVLENNPYLNCTDDLCNCVYQGERLYHYWDMLREHANMDSCKCAIVLEQGFDKGWIEWSYHCNGYGNYPRMQCVGPFCYCMKTNGILFGNPYTRSEYMKEMDSSKPNTFAICSTRTFTG